MENFKSRIEDIKELEYMIDVLIQKRKEEIINNKEFITDIKKYSNVPAFKVKNGKSISEVQSVYGVLVDKDGIIHRQFFNQDADLLLELPESTYVGSVTLQSMNYTLEQNDLLVYLAKSDVGHMYDEMLSALEREQMNMFAEDLEMYSNYVKSLDLTMLDANSVVSSQNTMKNDFDITNPNNSEATQEQIAQFRNLGFEIDTSELATSDHTIKELLNTSSSTLLVVKVNSDWKVFGLDENGKLKLEDNLQIVDNTTPFSVVTSDGKLENKIPTVEFRRKDNPDYSITLDRTTEAEERAYLVVGNSRASTELESETIKAPYVDVKNNEIIQEAAENPDKVDLDADNDLDDSYDPHEPEAPSERHL